jgi:hypothetical protein
MADGAGKYDDLCTTVREASHAEAALVIVLNGDRGSGFSCQVLGGEVRRDLLCDLLESVVRQMRAAPPDATS